MAEKPQLTVIKSGAKPTRKYLTLGDRGPEVLDLKVALAAAGMMTLNKSEEYDAQTRNGVILLQNRFGLPTTGVFDKKMCEPLQKAIEQQVSQQEAKSVGPTPVDAFTTMNAETLLRNDGKVAEEQPGVQEVAEKRLLQMQVAPAPGEAGNVIQLDERRAIATLDTGEPPVPWPVLIGAGFVLALIGAAYFTDRQLKAAPVMLEV